MGNVSAVLRKAPLKVRQVQVPQPVKPAPLIIRPAPLPPLPPLQSLTASEVRQGSYPGLDRANLSQSQLQPLKAEIMACRMLDSHQFIPTPIIKAHAEPQELPRRQSQKEEDSSSLTAKVRDIDNEAMRTNINIQNSNAKG